MLLKTRVVYITHLHGDHSLGLLRILEERDLINAQLPEAERTKIFVIVPECLLVWVKLHLKSFACPELNVVIQNHMLNPEKYYYYQHVNKKFNRVNELSDKPWV